MFVEGIDLTTETGLQSNFEKVLANVSKSDCYFSVDFSATNRIRRALMSGTRVEAYLGYENDLAVEVVRDPQFPSTFEQILKAVSEEFEILNVTDVEIKIVRGGDEKT